MSPAVLVSEVGPRDGLQSIARIMSLADKRAWIAAEAAAGVREIEVGSFVNPKLVPQLADTAAVVEFARSIPGLIVAALAANRRGGEAALAAGVHKITVPVSVSESHSVRNVRRTPLQMLDEVRAIAASIRERPHAERPVLEGSLSTAFGCTLEGIVPVERVVTLAAALLEAGCDEVSLADTTGYANPRQVKSLILKVRAAVGERALAGLHLHNTRGLGLANIMAALDLGIGTFDASLAGLGGCPFAPGASGNVVTEDLVFMLESMGIDTGIDLERLIAVRSLLAAALPGEPLYGFTAQAGLPKTFSPAASPAAGRPA